MKTRYPIIWLMLFLVTASCQKERNGEPSEVAKRETASDVLTLSEKAAANAAIGVEKAGPAAIHEELVLQGEVRAIPENLAAIVARLEGIVTKVTKKKGDKVNKGEALVTIESKKLAETKLAYIEAERRLKFAEDAVEREAKLVQKGISSKEAYQKVDHEKAESEINHAAALQRLKLLGFSERRLHDLEKNPDQKLTRYTLRAPFTGEVIDKNVTMGEAVKEDKTLFHLADLSELMVEIKVPMRSVPLFAKGATVRVQCTVLGFDVEGTVDHVASMAEADTRTVPVRITISNPEGKWRPGMPARVRLKNASRSASVTVPVGAVYEVDGKSVVFVQTSPTAYRLVTVKPGGKDDSVQEIVEGLRAGDPVAVENSLTLKAEWLRRRGE